MHQKWLLVLIFRFPQKRWKGALWPMSFASQLFCPCVLAISYSVVWIAVWVLSVAVICPVNSIPLPAALAQFQLILSQTKSWWDKEELDWAENQINAEYGFGEDQMIIIPCVIWSLGCTTLFQKGIVQHCSSRFWSMFQLLFSLMKVKITLCTVYCKSPGCSAILFVKLELCESFIEKQNKNTEEVSLLLTKRDSGLLLSLFQGTPHVTHQGFSRLTWAYLWILPSCKRKKILNAIPFCS